MKSRTIELKGINRAIPSGQIADGWLDEAINTRLRNGRRQAVGHATKLYNLPVNAANFNRIWHHDQDNLDNFIGLDKDNNVSLIDLQGTGASQLIKSYADSPVIDIEFMNRFMIVVHNTGTDVFLFKDGVYTLVNMPLRPRVNYYTDDRELVETEEALGSEAIIGKYVKKLNTESHKNRHTGGIMFRAAIRMYDGSYILHTLPEYLLLGSPEYLLMYEKAVDGDGEANDPNWIRFQVARANLILNPADFLGINSDIFTHLVIFACHNEELYEMSTDVLTDELILDKVKEDPPSHNYAVSFIDIFDSVSEDFTKMADSASWYNVYEKLISEIQEEADIFREELDMKGFYNDYATRETLTVDQFSHHNLSGRYAYNYNSRLILLNTTTKFGNYPYKILKGSDIVHFGSRDGYYFEANRDCKLLVTLNTSSGLRYKVIDLGEGEFYKSDSDPSQKAIFFTDKMIGYPDTRATNIDLLMKFNNNYYSIKSWTLTKSANGNYAYYHSKDFSINASEISYIKFEDEGFIQYDESGRKDLSWFRTLEDNYPLNIVYFDINDLAEPVILQAYEEDNYTDTNRVQLSELDNPFVFPAINSYQVSTGTALACATNTEPLSQGQFGEYPLIVFTSKGIWTLLQGTDGEVVFRAVLPLNGEVPNNINNIISTGTGVCYTTDRGLYMVSGRDVQELSALLCGSPNTDLQEVEDFTFRLNHIQLVQLSSSLSTVDAKLLLSDAKFGFDKINNELWVTNNDYNYSYVFSFESNYWSKRSESYRVLINSYPKLLVLRENTDKNGVFDRTKENFDTPVHVLCTTRPCKIDDLVNFNLIHRVIQRCELNTANGIYAGFYVFASNDLRTWQKFQGNDKKSGSITDIFCTRSHLKAKYFVFVFASTMTEVDVINYIDLQYYNKLTNKIR